MVRDRDRVLHYVFVNINKNIYKKKDQQQRNSNGEVDLSRTQNCLTVGISVAPKTIAC